MPHPIPRIPMNLVTMTRPPRPRARCSTLPGSGRFRYNRRMTISYEKLEEVAYELNRRAAIAVPLDAKQAFVKAAERETNPDAKRALLAVINNADTAVAEQSSMCGDTGCPRFYAKVGNEVKLEGGFVNLERALRAA